MSRFPLMRQVVDGFIGHILTFSNDNLARLMEEASQVNASNSAWLTHDLALTVYRVAEYELDARLAERFQEAECGGESGVHNENQAGDLPPLRRESERGPGQA